VDISDQTSNHVDEYRHIPFDFIITVCDHAREACPVFPSSALKLHRNFPDPAKASGTEEEIMSAFVHVRNMIKDYAQEFCNTYLN
jgi:arsenate reductase